MSRIVGWLDRFRVQVWLWPLASIITLVGYFGPWIPHPVAGLVVTGLDLGEYVKFLPSVINGEVSIWRQGFYTPLVAVSMTCSLLSYRAVYGYRFVMKLALVLLGIVAALNMLPPAWTPLVLQTEEFRLQTVTIVLCIAMLMLSPLLARLKAIVVYAFLTAVCVAGVWFPISGFLRVLPNISELYRHSLRPGWGMYLCTAGLVLLVASYGIGYAQERRHT